MAGELGTADLLDPNPDILGLFTYYNDLYFDNQLHACTVDWSTKRMTLCAGICKYEQGSCAIRLSEPLLKYRSCKELKETLLHEMIHAYLWLTNSNNDHDDHGPCFQSKMRSINTSTLEDFQRPQEGYDISIYHNFSDEVDLYRRHQWQCTRCGDLIKRASNRPPSQKDCFKKSVPGNKNACDNLGCHWHSHQRLCGGEYEKIAEPEGYKDKKRLNKSSGKEDSTSATTLSPKMVKKSKTLDTKVTNKSRGKEQDVAVVNDASIEKFFSSIKGGEKKKAITTIDLECSDFNSTNLSNENFKVQGTKRRREYVDLQEEVLSTDGDEGSVPSSENPNDGTLNVGKGIWQHNECTVIIGWKDWYAFEGEEDEVPLEALDNKRTRRRVSEKSLRSKLYNENYAENASTVAKRSPITEEMITNEEVNGNINEVDSSDIFKTSPYHNPASPLSADNPEVDVCVSSSETNYKRPRDSIMCCISNATDIKVNNEEINLTSSPKDDNMFENDAGNTNGTHDGSACAAKVIRSDAKREGRCNKTKRITDLLSGSSASEVSGPTNSSALCPICQEELCGNIEDPSFNVRFNAHIDACMKKAGDL